MKATEDELEYRQLTLWDFMDTNPAEPEGDSGSVYCQRIAEDNNIIHDSREDSLLKWMTSREAMFEAARKVKSNKGKGGIDKMSVYELKPWLEKHYGELAEQIRRGNYKPNPVRRVVIPKGEPGKFRKLGIPTVIDRMVQQCIASELTPIGEREFSDYSYGFRPERGCHDALKRCVELANEGYVYVVSMDLEKFFDTIHHSKLMQVLSKYIDDGQVLSLIHKYLNAGVLENGYFVETETGAIQGGPLSPLLGNFMLNELDWELERRNHKFVRYADDLLIFCKSRKAAERTMENIIPFIEKKLFLKVNREKSTVSKISGIKYLGYGFYFHKGCRLRVHPKSVVKMKAKLKELTRKSQGISYKVFKKNLSSFIRGWVNYFVLADMKTLMAKTDEWYRRRIRTFQWKRWKRVRTRYRELRALNMPEEYVHKMANCRTGPWRASTWLSKAITNKVIHEKWGYISLLDYYLERRELLEN